MCDFLGGMTSTVTTREGKASLTSHDLIASHRISEEADCLGHVTTSIDPTE